LIDTSIWLDLVKDYRQQPVISALEDLVDRKEVTLIVPEVVLAEFERNKTRVADDAKRSLKSHFTLVRDAINRFAPEDTKQAAIDAVNEADHSAVMKGEAVNASIERVEKLLHVFPVLEATSEIKLRAAERALAGRAPFHRAKNSIGDAIIFETYADAVSHDQVGDRFAFVTSNVHDFSQGVGDQRLPHADLSEAFEDETQSTYWTKLPDLIENLDEFLLPDMDFEFRGFSEHRLLSEIMEAEHRLFLQVWYNRHMNLRAKIADGSHAVVEKVSLATQPYRNDQTLDTVWAVALTSATKVEAELGPGNVGPWDDFEWGMITGKLSALRWIMGDEWDSLDT
jgi:hypothetical protein